MKKICFIACCIIILFSGVSFANDKKEKYSVLAKSAYSSEWLALGYYKKQYFGGYHSDVDDDSFFLSGLKGYNSPEEELLATVSEFNHYDNVRASIARCTYPARLHWLKYTHPNLLRSLEYNCPELDAWKEKFNGDSVSLVFPSAYIDSPSSMFGHTLLRINNKEKNSILSLSINYAATKNPNDSELAFIYKGLVGGYPGDITILPYYMKLKEYKDMESRDIWEYYLNFTATETLLLLEVLWEVKDKKFDYYFFTENCSYRILSFMNVVRPSSGLLDDFDWVTIPIDTVRAAKNKGFVDSVNYRPSVKTQFNNSIAQLSLSDRDRVLQWVSSNGEFAIDELLTEPTEAAAVLDTAFEFSRISKSSKLNRRKLSYNLLNARKNIHESSNLKAVDQPLYSDDEGHESNKMTMVLGYQYGQQYTAFKMRPSYHDLLDPPLGYPKGSQLKFLDIEASYYKFIHIFSINDNLHSLGVQYSITACVFTANDKTH